MTKDSILHTVGAYSVGPGDSEIAAGNGLQLGVVRVDLANPSLSAQYEAAGLKVVDMRVQQLLYRRLCPSGPKSCSLPSSSELDSLVAEIGKIGKSNSSDNLVAGYYLLDEYWTDMREALWRIRRELSLVDPGRPTLCALSLPIPTQPGQSVATSKASFRIGMRNYSASWCDYPVIYSYANAGESPARLLPDWTMQDLLPWAVRELAATGWDSEVYPFVGVPQATIFYPGLSAGKKYWFAVPSSDDLKAQILSFCRNGAGAIVGYAWNDHASGSVWQLYNSDRLRSGFSEGVRLCRTRYWNSQ